jgi:hypothetical protein
MKKRIEPVEPAAGQEGQSLVVILLLGAVLAFFGAFLTRMLIQEAAQIVKTKGRDKLFTAGDAALQRSMSVLLQDDTNWSNADGLAGYASVTVTTYAYTDIPGLKYYIKIKKGTLQDTGNTGAATDWHINQWANIGSLTNDRTIFVRTVDTRTNKEERFYTTIHRTDPPAFQYGGDAIAAAGNVSLGNNWQGKVYNSCLGPYGGSGDLPNSEGSLTVGGTVDDPSKFSAGGNWGGYNYSPGTSPGFPALTVPAGTVGVYSNAAYTAQLATNAVVSSTIYLKNPVDGTTINYEVSQIDFAGSDSIYVTGPGKVALWVTASSGTSVKMGGNTDVIINPNGSTECCQAKMFTIYVTQVDPNPDTGDRCITWNGTPAGIFLIVGPKANMEYKGGGSNIFKGAIAVQNLSIAPNSNAIMLYDACLKDRPPVDNYSAPPLITTSWHQIGLKGQIP